MGYLAGGDSPRGSPWNGRGWAAETINGVVNHALHNCLKLSQLRRFRSLQYPVLLKMNKLFFVRAAAWLAAVVCVGLSVASHFQCFIAGFESNSGRFAQVMVAYPDTVQFDLLLGTSQPKGHWKTKFFHEPMAKRDLYITVPQYTLFGFGLMTGPNGFDFSAPLSELSLIAGCVGGWPLISRRLRRKPAERAAPLTWCDARSSYFFQLFQSLVLQHRSGRITVWTSSIMGSATSKAGATNS